MTKERTEKGSILDRLVSRAARKAVPVKVRFDVTYACNLKCVHCLVVSEDRPELDSLQIEKLLGELASSGCLYLSYSGGEAFLREDFLDILRLGHRLGFYQRVMTNGTLLSDEVVAGLSALHVGEVVVSLYGDTPDLHDSITQVGGSFEKTVDGVRRLTAKRIRVSANISVLRENVGRFRQMVALTERLGAVAGLGTTLFPTMDGSMGPLSHRVSTECLEEVQWHFLEKDASLWGTVDEWDRERWLANPPCGAASMTCAISPYGDVLPCGVMPLSAGNVLDQPFSDIWEHSEVMTKIRGLRRRDLKKCRDCDLARFCTTCPALSLTEDGDLLGPSSYRCDEASVRKAAYEKAHAGKRSCSRAKT
jgi:radical SAM protein with 4Fe4S-binding SPASM domain